MTIYLGISQAFIGADFTAVSLWLVKKIIFLFKEHPEAGTDDIYNLIILFKKKPIDQNLRMQFLIITYAE